MNKDTINFLKTVSFILVATVLGFVFLALLLFGILIISDKATVKERPLNEITYGVTFSPQYTQSLGLEWEKTYIQVLDELKVRRLRIPTYWEVTEPQQGDFNFSEIDFMLNEAKKRDASVLLVVGLKQPRWPECHIPGWVLNKDAQTRQSLLLNYIEKTVQRYKDHPSVWGYQVENEPFVNFGEGCMSQSVQFLKQEVETVKKIDPAKPVIMTDAGEKGLPLRTMKLSDIFGTTVYRVVHNNITGYIKYPHPALFYRLKSDLTRRYFAPNNQKTILVEMQAEPWSPVSLDKLPFDNQRDIFSLEDFKNYINFTQRIGFTDVYLWGVEWWYFAKLQGDPSYWEYSKTLFSSI